MLAGLREPFSGIADAIIFTQTVETRHLTSAIAVWTWAIAVQHLAKEWMHNIAIPSRTATALAFHFVVAQAASP
jgi:hypothetical protein